MLTVLVLVLGGCPIHTTRNTRIESISTRRDVTNRPVKRNLVASKLQEGSDTFGFDFREYDYCVTESVETYREVTRVGRSSQGYIPLLAGITACAAGLGMLATDETMWVAVGCGAGGPLMIWGAIEAIRARDTTEYGDNREKRTPLAPETCRPRPFSPDTPLVIGVDENTGGMKLLTVGESHSAAVFELYDAYDALGRNTPLEVTVALPNRGWSKVFAIPAETLRRSARAFTERLAGPTTFAAGRFTVQLQNVGFAVDPASQRVKTRFAVKNTSSFVSAPLYMKFGSTAWGGERYLYLGRIPAGATHRAEFVVKTGRLSELEIVTFRLRSPEDQVGSMDLAFDRSGNTLGDWDSGGDNLAHLANKLAVGQVLEGSVHGPSGDLTDWIAVETPQKGKVVIRVHGANISLSQPLPDRDALQPAGFVRRGLGNASSNIVVLRRAGRMRGAEGETLEFMGGGGRYLVQLRSRGITRQEYRVEASVTPVEVQAKVSRRDGREVYLDKGANDGVYLGRKGTFYYRRRYRAGTFEAVEVGPNESRVKVTGGGSEVYRRLKSLDARMPITRDAVPIKAMKFSGGELDELGVDEL